MKFTEIPSEKFSARVMSTDGSSLPSLLDQTTEIRGVVAVEPLAVPGEFGLRLHDRYLTVRVIDPVGAVDLNDQLSRGRALLAQLADRAEDGSVELHIAFFMGQTLDMGDLEVGIDEYVQRGVSRIARQRPRKVAEWLESQFAYTVDGTSYFFLSAGPVIEQSLSDADQLGTEHAGAHADQRLDVPDAGPEAALPGPPGVPRTEPTVKNSFLLHGHDVRAVSTSTSVPGGRVIHTVSKLTRTPTEPETNLRLARGRLAFVDWTQAGQVQILAEAQLSALTQDESSYLRKWDQFGDIEGELLLKEAREFGVVRYADAHENRDGTVTVSVIDAAEGAINALYGDSVESVELVEVEPPYIANPRMTFADFSRIITEAEGGPERGRRRGQETRSTQLRVQRFDNDHQAITLDTERVPASGSLVLSLQGEVAQIRRRQSARKAILQGRSANPQLGLLIEEKGEITSLRSPQKVAPLTAYVRDKIFRNAPTVMQEKAIEVALNTPDLALIQGPPGTGKTTVIAAILERLNEEAAASGKSLAGRVLLTGFQHDAVENMIDRLSLNAIPVPKFGKRSGSASDGSAFERHLDDWCTAIAVQLRARNPQLAEVEHESLIRDLYVQYLTAPSRRLAIDLVTAIDTLEFSVVGEEVARRVARLKTRLTAEEGVVGADAKQLDAARRIRVRPESFADDGPARAEEAMIDLESFLAPSEVRILDKASLWDSRRGTPPFLAELAATKRELLLRLTEPPVFRVEKQSDEVLEVAKQALDRIRRHGHSATDLKSAVLAEFLAELESNPQGMVDSVAEYSYAFAATVQQSVNRDMQRRKGLHERSDRQLEYDYVIIDEAARVSPRDLMIPMAQGKKIVLVGDHRQLPHIIDEEVARSMESGEEGPGEAEWLKQSMFEYLFADRLKSLELADGIQRRVTLDQQFRMHPVLGDLISRNFYERFDRAERFGSGLPARNFTHGLTGTSDAPAMWLDVPSSAGPARRYGTSWTRQAEADRITAQLREWIETPEGSTLTYGVISFYKAQADQIRQQLRRELGPVADDDRRVRVGTVDSFQGMEFDVVFLSVVRSIRPDWVQRGTDEVAARGLFGHLGLYNRLNVAMSRQKRLLVAVGDAGLVQHPLAAQYIPGLVDFYRLSGGNAPTAETHVAEEASAPRSATPPLSSVAPPKDDLRPSGFISRLFGRRRG